MVLVYNAIFKPCEEGGYTVVVPDLPGCVTEGDDLAEALFMAEDAACGWVLTELEDGNRPPAPSDRNEIKLDDGEFINAIVLNMDEYAEKYGNKAVKKTLTIPAWMNTFVEKYGISCSKVLQDSINSIYETEYNTN